MSGPQTYERARGRAVAKYGLYVHILVYAAVILMLVAINLFNSPEVIWFIWPMMGWGLAVLIHAAVVFLMADRNAVVDRLTERELKRSDREATTR
jgi:hypothetical protein